jgi:uncharacterized protein (TIGR03435 family)
MTDLTDMDLLRDYAASGVELAFSELVRRHINLVYSVALRFTRDAEDAQDATQAVFIILARKAAHLGPNTILPGWLYETTRFTAMKLLRAKTRQIAREQEAYMQSTLTEPTADTAWRQLEPILEEGMSRLPERDRTLLALRFFEGKSGAESAELLGIQESAAGKRALRAVEKLRAFFRKRGVLLSAPLIMAAMSAHSVQAAPPALAKSVTTLAVVKGATLSGSLLTLISGALKLMAWTKIKTTAVISATVILATGAIAASVYETIWKHPNSSSYPLLQKAPPTMVIRSTHFPRAEPGGIGLDKCVYVNESLPQLLAGAYKVTPWRMVLPDDMPAGRYDYLSTLPDGQNNPALRNALKKTFGLVAGQPLLHESEVYLLKLKNAGKLESHLSKGGFLEGRNLMRLMGRNSIAYSQGVDPMKEFFLNEPLSDSEGKESEENLRYLLDCYMKKPVIDRTGATGRYDITVQWPRALYPEQNTQAEKLKGMASQLDAYGLELVPSREKIQMLVVKRVK